MVLYIGMYSSYLGWRAALWLIDRQNRAQEKKLEGERQTNVLETWEAYTSTGRHIDLRQTSRHPPYQAAAVDNRSADR